MLQVLEFTPDLDWFNSPPLHFFEELQGKIIVLDFWTYCSINCIHTLPRLSQLEKKYENEPVVLIGVHSAKFENEKISSHIRDAILRYEIQHPVVNDVGMTLWEQLDVHSWPTFVIIGPRGQVLFRISGEKSTNQLDASLQKILASYSNENLNREPLPKSLEKEHFFLASPLSFPGKIAIDNDNQRLFISDSNHHRILITSLEGRFMAQIGSGNMGFDETSFNHPQGVDYHNNTLYVADTENHALRKINLENMRIETIGGNGRQGEDFHGGKKGTEQSLNSPWDIAVKDNQVFIAMAGSHQIWVYDIETKILRNFSGTGLEQNYNNQDFLYSHWAQPSGICTDGDKIYIADSESSSIRMIDITQKLSDTLVGGDENPQNLFAYGNEDGKGTEAKLQHPLGIALNPKTHELIVADSYNHQIKILNPQKKEIHTLAGTGYSGYSDAIGIFAQFSEPGGVAVSNKGLIYIADTNNHQIRMINPKNGEASTLKLRDIPHVKKK